MANPPGQNLLVIERILRDRDGIWRQINDERDLRGLTLQMLTSSAVSLAIFGLVLGARLSMTQTVALVMVSITVISVLTLAFAPISLFFLIAAQNYEFFK